MVYCRYSKSLAAFHGGDNQVILLRGAGTLLISAVVNSPYDSSGRLKAAPRSPLDQDFLRHIPRSATACTRFISYRQGFRVSREGGIASLQITRGSRIVRQMLGRRDVLQGGPAKKVQAVFKDALGITGLLVAGYMFMSSLPDIRRYIRISRM